ncbi:MAG: outer membrane lipoprotein-sorting protein [Calditrichia bacterium]
MSSLFLKLATLGLLLFSAAGLSAQQPQMDAKVKEIVQYIDQLYRSESSFSEVEMDIVTSHWERTLKMKIWTEGTKKTFIRITAPKKEDGVGTLRIGNEMWNYLPKTNKVIKIPPSMMMSSWMGSDFNNDDLVSEFSLWEDYRYSRIHPDYAEPGFIYIECIPRENLAVVWGRIVMKVRENDKMPVQDRYYDEKGKLMRLMNYSNIREFDGKKLPSVIELIPQDEEGNKTVLRYLSLDFNLPLENDIFSLRNLRSYR